MPIQKEIEYLTNYIALERIRLEDKVSVQFHTDLSSEELSMQVAPMLFIVFVENAFKHLDTMNALPSKVEINMHVKDNALIFRCQNTRDNLREAVDPDLSVSGIGLDNVKKRLELIYPGSYQYQVSEMENEFIVDLSIQLK